MVAHWELRDQTRLDLALRPEDSEGLIDIIRSIRGVRIAAFFEELPDGKIRVSMRSKDRELDVCKIASEFGGGGHALAAGIRMKGPLEEAKARVLTAIRKSVEETRKKS
jgi:phosphoesterase RecJ-like protein